MSDVLLKIENNLTITFADRTKKFILHYIPTMFIMEMQINQVILLNQLTHLKIPSVL